MIKGEEKDKGSKGNKNELAREKSRKIKNKSNEKVRKGITKERGERLIYSGDEANRSKCTLV